MRYLSSMVTKVASGAVILAATGLVGCDHARTALGYDRKNPDAYKVVDRAPLCVPPDFKLRPPRPGASRPQEKSAQEQAQDALLEEGQQCTVAINPTSDGEKGLLNQIGEGDQSVREALEKEHRSRKAQKLPTLAKKLGLKELDDEKVIDPVAESERLDKKHKAQ